MPKALAIMLPESRELINPYEPPLAKQSDLLPPSSGIRDWIQPERLPFYLLTAVQSVVVLGAHQLWMEDPDNGLTPILDASWDHALSVLAFISIFFFLNCCASQWVDRKCILTEQEDASKSQVRESDFAPRRGTKLFPILSKLLVAIFLGSGALMSWTYGRPHEVTWFMLTMTLLVLMTNRFTSMMYRARIQNITDSPTASKAS